MKVPPAVSRLIFSVVMVTCAFFVHGAGHNQNSRYNLVRALVEDGTVRIDRFRSNTHDISAEGGHWFSDKAPGLSLLAVVPYAAGLRLGQPTDRIDPEPWALHGLTLTTCSLATAFAAVSLLHLLVELGICIEAAVLAVIGWVLGTNALAYAGLFVSHQLVASLLTLALVAVVRAGRTTTLSRARTWAFGAGLAAGGAVLSEFPAAVLASAIGVYGIARLGAKTGAAFAAGGLIPVAVLGAYNAACFGDPFHLGYQSLANAYTEGMSGGIFGFGAPNLRIGAELLLYEFRGLLPLSPFLALTPLGLVWMLRVPSLRGLGVVCGIGLISVTALISGFSFWNGGAAMGPRHLVPALPFAIIAVAVAIDRMQSWWPRSGLAIASGLIAVSIVICTACVAVAPEFIDGQAPTEVVPGMPIPRADHPIRDLVFPLLARGHVSFKAVVNGGFSYESWYPGHEHDAFNLGEVVGLTGKLSLIPLFAAWLGLGIAIVRQLRRHRASG